VGAGEDEEYDGRVGGRWRGARIGDGPDAHGAQPLGLADLRCSPGVLPGSEVNPPVRCPADRRIEIRSGTIPNSLNEPYGWGFSFGLLGLAWFISYM